MIKCLVVDNKSMMRKVAKVQAEILGLKVIEAENGIEALDICREKKIDIILLDWMMPEMDGIEFLDNIQRSETSGKPYVVMCSAKHSKSDIKTAMDAGADKYIVKPVTNINLKQVLQELSFDI
ncbi:response regulator [Rickettsiales bacterium]|nr:response regulator [Rickettsiales bacterium]